MDLALLKKMKVYAPDTQIAGLISEGETPESTLIKADFSMFHEMPTASMTARHGTITPSTIAPKDPAVDQTKVDQTPPQEVKPPVENDYDKGYKDGKAKADGVHLGTIKLLQSAVDTLQAELKNMASDIERSHLSHVVNSLRAAFPSLMSTGLHAELLSILTEVCSVAETGFVTLHVHPDDEGGCKDMCKAHGLEVNIIIDEEMQPGHIKALWQNGGAEIDCKSVSDACLARAEAALTTLTSTQIAEI